MRFQFAVFALIVATGCSPTPTVRPKATNNTADPRENIESVREVLRKSNTELEGYRQALSDLSAIAAHQPERKPTALTADEIEFLKSRLRLTDSDLADITRPEFGPLDAAILNQAMLFRDATRTLDVESATPSVKADAAMDWAVRHVRLEARSGPPDPPGMVVLRGRGTVLERTCVLITMLDRLGLATFAIADGSGDLASVWAAGVWSEGELWVFDMRLGLRLPGSLSALIANANLVQPFVDLGARFSLPEARAFYGLPLAQLAPRFRLIDSALPERDAKLCVNVRAWMAGGAALRLAGWPPNGHGAPPKALAEFLPPDDGGTDRPEPNRPRRMDIYRASLVPWGLLPRQLRDLPGPLGAHVRRGFADVTGFEFEPGIGDRLQRTQLRYDSLRSLMSQERELPANAQMQADLVRELTTNRQPMGDTQGPTLGEMLIRGRVDEATRAITLIETQMQSLRGRADAANAANDALQWANKVTSAYTTGFQAQQSNNQEALKAVNERLAALAQDVPQSVELYVRWLGAGYAESRLSYLTAVLKHDQAAAAARRNNNPAVWRSAIELWRSFLNNHADAPEATHARRFLAVALRQAGQKEAATEAFRQAAGDATLPADRAACAWLAKQ